MYYILRDLGNSVSSTFDSCNKYMLIRVNLIVFHFLQPCVCWYKLKKSKLPPLFSSFIWIESITSKSDMEFAPNARIFTLYNFFFYMGKI